LQFGVIGGAPYCEAHKEAEASRTLAEDKGNKAAPLTMAKREVAVKVRPPVEISMVLLMYKIIRAFSYTFRTKP